MVPTLAVGGDPGAARGELFGPAVSVHRVDSDEQALERANSDPSGLAAYVYATDTVRAMEIGARIASGEVRINGAHLDDLADGSAQSFWAPSGIGGHGPNEPWRVFRGERIVGVDSEDLVT
jgi:acyl-CoA reductase-like NAD-dependent aldehyde dehydrogenase